MTSGDEPILALPSAPDAIELRHLRAFVAVAEQLNFARAAASLYVSAPALSRQIRALERQLGCDLFRRSTHQVELTIAGEALLDGARRVLSEMDGAVSATRAVGGELTARIARFWEHTAAMEGPGSDLQRLRNDAEEMHRQFTPPAEIVVRSVNAGGVPSLVLSTDPAAPATVLYLHGGAYVMGSAYGYRPLAGALAIAAGTAVLVPEFRLAPEYPFPAAVEDTVRAYQWMIDQGEPASHMLVAGDSSGGGLAMSLLMTLRAEQRTMPGGAALMCPAVDLTVSALLEPPSSTSRPAFDIDEARRLVNLYLDGHPVDDPLVAPLNTDLTGLPPLLIQACTGDPFLVDARRLTDHARKHGVAVEFELYPADTHAFQVFWSFLPEAADALASIGTFARRLSGATTEAQTPAG